ncbi:hypothetical protein FQN49_001186 [Arthroderma sp. PD_2]|nr:hypothetical protein FQN49_001186 [Arthroderma sp. PD_2]
MACISVLPSEILLLICDELYCVHPPSLVAFACTSKRLYELSQPLLLKGSYHTLFFTVDPKHRAYLYQDVQACVDLLRRERAFNAVRRLIITGPGYVCSRSRGWVHRGFDWSHVGPVLGPQAIDSLDMTYTTLYRLCDDSGDGLEDDDWIPFAKLLGRLSRLADLVYLHSKRFPLCMLEALHASIPRCKLYLHSFALSSIIRGGRPDDYEYKVVTSPSLYSIGVVFSRLNGYGKPHELHNEAILRMIYGLTPNLRELYINPLLGLYYLPVDTPLPGHHWQECWQGFPEDQKLPETYHKGSLDRIQVYHQARNISRECLEELDRHTDFSVLRVLKLRGRHCTYIELGAMEFLSTSNFASLETVELWMQKYGYMLRMRRSSCFINAASRFLGSLPALTTLKLQGWQPDSNLDFLQYSRLRKLELYPAEGEFLSLENLNQINKYCPLLSTLKTCVRRLRGNPDEIAMYKALGSMARLEDLTLTLDVIDPKLLGLSAKQTELKNSLRDNTFRSFYHYCILRYIPNDPSFNEFNRRYCTADVDRLGRNGYIRDGLINSAIDTNLACSIFRLINSSKPAASVPLRKMIVSISSHRYISLARGDGDLEGYCRLLEYLGAKCSVEPKYSDVTGESLVATRTESKNLQYLPYPNSSLDDNFGPGIAPVFRRLWPAKGGKRGWRDDWHSFPLATGDDDAEIERWLNHNKQSL